MTDYQPLIAKAVAGLAKNTGEARRSLYERARAALVAQLRSIDPPLNESDITKERLALEEAIRRVEADAARKALAEPRTLIRSEPKVEPAPPKAAPLEVPASAAEAPKEKFTPAMALRAEPSAAPAAPAAAAAGLAPAATAEPAQPLAPPVTAANEDAKAEEAAPAKPSARSRILSARTSSLAREGLKGFREVVNEVDGLGNASAKAAQSARETRDFYSPSPRYSSPPPEEPRPHPEELEPRYAPEQFVEDYPPPPPPLPAHEPEPAYDESYEPPPPLPRYERQPPPPAEFEEDYATVRPPRSYGRTVTAIIFLIIVGAAAAVGWQYRSDIQSLYQMLPQFRSPPPTQTAQQQKPPAPKFPGRVPQETAPGQSASTAPASAQPAAQVAQRAVLYEADPNDPQGKRFPGSVIWRTETVSPGPGLAPELAVRADISIPERHMTVTWSLRRNTDKALPASHTIEIMFTLPPDFPGGGIANVPGILMKDSEEVRGMPLAGLAVKVTNGYFLIGLNAAQEDLQRNLQLLKERSWFDILVVYSNGGRAILTLEKGPPGERAFAEAFAAWGQ